jgi:hypothetical protein
MMKQQLFHSLATASLLLGILGGGVQAQENLPPGPSNYEHDLQLFAPFELDLDNMPVVDQWSGYYFNYDKLFWSYSGERVTLGSEKVTAFEEIIFYDNPQDIGGDPPPPHQIFNTIVDVPPKAGFAFGNRYELGYHDRDHGWMIGVLDGPELNQTEFYGFARVDTNGDGIPDGLPPFIDPDFTDNTDVGPGPGGAQQAGFGLRAFGFGSVPVLFETPPGYLTGFRDYTNALADASIGTQGGPMLYIGNYGMSLEDDNLPIQFFRLADDLNGNGVFGSVPVIIVGEDGVARLGVLHDWEDLHNFNVYFDNVTLRNTTESDGVEAMWSQDVTNRHYMAKKQNNQVTLSWGARYMRLYDEFFADMQGSILHDVFVDTSFINSIVGPQVGVKWQNRRQRWTLTADGKFMFGYNTADWDQFGLMGEGLVPGGLNQPLYARPTAFAHGLQEREFSPVAEMRLRARYHVTTAFSLTAGYTGMFVGNVRRASPSVHYSLPAFGYRDVGTQDLLVNGLDLGVEFVY